MDLPFRKRGGDPRSAGEVTVRQASPEELAELEERGRGKPVFRSFEELSAYWRQRGTDYMLRQLPRHQQRYEKARRKEGETNG